MTITTMIPTTGTPSTAMRAGLVLSAVVGLGNGWPLVVPDIDWGDVPAPPLFLSVLAAAIGLVSVACAVSIWRTGDRKLIRINAAALIVNALPVFPGVFMDMPAYLRVISALTTVATVAAVVLTMRTRTAPAPVHD